MNTTATLFETIADEVLDIIDSEGIDFDAPTTRAEFPYVRHEHTHDRGFTYLFADGSALILDGAAALVVRCV